MTGNNLHGGASAKAYLRVSTDSQVESGLGLEAQVAAIQTAVARLRLPLTQTFTDAGLSGGLPLEQRPGLLAALDALTRGDVLVVAKRDRLGRDLLNVAMISKLVERKGARIVSAAGEGSDDDAPTSVLMRSIIDAFSEYERAIIRERTRVALAAKRARGEVSGTIPLGFRVGADGRLEEHPDEQRIIHTVRQMRGAGKTVREVTEELNRRGHTTRAGSRYRDQYVSRIEWRRSGFTRTPHVQDSQEPL